MIVRSFFLVLFSIFLISPLSGAAPSKEEILERAEATESDFIRSLEEMVKIESGSMDFEGLDEMARYAENRLKELGAETTLLQPDQADPRKLVRGRFHGNGKLKIMLIAHMDTVYERGTLKKQPFRREGERVYGPGISDDKGGIAMILHTLGILREFGWENFETLTVLFNPDEEIGSPLSGSVITEHAEGQDFVLSYESGSLRLGTSGIGRLTLKVRGNSAHASVPTSEAENALLELAKLIAATDDVADEISGIQFNWTLAKAGTVSNRIPDEATASADVRIIDPAAVAKFEKAVKARIEENRHNLKTEVELTVRGSHRPILNPTPEGRKLASLAQAIFSELPPTEEDKRKGIDYRSLEVIERGGGGTDAGFAAQAEGVAVLEGLGVTGGRIHSPDEYLNIESIVPRLYLNCRMLIELGKGYR